MSGFGDDEEEYRGPVTVVLTGTDRTESSAPENGPASSEVEVDAHLAGHFSPLTGDYRWKGRLSPHPYVTAAFTQGVRTVLIRTPGGHEGTGVLADPNLWGGHPVSGAGAPPFAVPAVDVAVDGDD